jgi:hypothetical protein
VKRADVLASVALVALALFVFVETRSYPPSMSAGSPGPAFFPRLLAALLSVFAAGLLLRGVRTGHGAGSPPSLAWHGLARSGVVLGLVALFLLVVGRGDFFLMLAPLLAAVMAVMGERGFGALLVAPVCFAAFVYLIFFRLFGVPFPTVL